MLLNENWQATLYENGVVRYVVPAKVPGCIHADLQRAGIIGDFFCRDNADKVQWIENCNVVYETNFEVLQAPAHTFLCFESVDVYARASLNGVVLGEMDDMFHPWRFSVDGILRPGTNALKVEIFSPIERVKGLPELEGAAFSSERVHTRRIQCTYGWDWVARFVTMGICAEVSLQTEHQDMPTALYVYTKSISDYSAQLQIRADFSHVSQDAFAQWCITDEDGCCVWRKKRRILEETMWETVDIPNPKLWYPAGYGHQPLYRLCVKTETGNKETSFGIRTVSVLQLEDAPDSPEAKLSKKIKEAPYYAAWDRNETPSSFILLVNGVRIFCQGGNWVPCEPFPSEVSPDKIKKLLAQASFAGYNILRVWGGGIFEQDVFYDECDRLGILVTQDFLMACGQYPEYDDAFLDKLRLETKAAALRLRNHPSLVWWSGDNENGMSADENQKDYRGRKAALCAIAPVLREYDPDRVFFPTSPIGGTPYASCTRGTTHVTWFLGDIFDFAEKGDFRNYRQFFESFLARFDAEQPVMGMPFVSSLRKFLTDEDIFGDDTSMSEYHTKTNPYMSHTLYQYIEWMSAGLFGKFRSGADRIEKMQFLQCEWIRLTMELFRRNQWYSSGMIYWMFNDCWPAANSWSIVDYYASPKPGMYAFRRAAKPVIMSVTRDEDGCGVYVCSHSLRPEQVRGSIYLYNVHTGTEREHRHFELEAPVNGAKKAICLTNIQPGDEEVILCDYSWGSIQDRAYFMPTSYAQMGFIPSAPIVEELEDAFLVRAEETLPIALIDVPYLLEDNGMFLKKGESCRIAKVSPL